MIPFRLVANAIREFFISAVDDDALPFSGWLTLTLDNRDRNQRIQSHPVDLLAWQGKRVEVVVRICVTEWHHVRTSVFGAG